MTAAPPRPLRLLLADDHTVLRAGLRILLDGEPDLHVVGEAGSGAEAVALVARKRPHIVLMDLEMPGLDGLEATRLIAQSGVGTRVLVLTMHEEEALILQVLDAGGSGYVLKRFGGEELLEAIRTVARGEVYLYPAATRLLLAAYRHDLSAAAEPAAPASPLTERETEVLRLTVEGYTSPEIGSRLYLSGKTVDTYRQRIMTKLGLRHRTALVHYALETGLLKPSDGGRP